MENFPTTPGMNNPQGWHFSPVAGFQSLPSSTSTVVDTCNKSFPEVNVCKSDPLNIPTSGSTTAFVKFGKSPQWKLCLSCNDFEVDSGVRGTLSNFQNNQTTFESLCKILQVPIFPEFSSDHVPFCSMCLKSIKDFFHLQKKIQELIEVLSELRTVIAARIVTSFPNTSVEHVNYAVKRKIHEEWSSKVPKSSSSVPDFEQRFNCILNTLHKEQAADATDGITFENSNTCSRDDADISSRTEPLFPAGFEAENTSSSSHNSMCVSPVSNNSLEHVKSDMTLEQAVPKGWQKSDKNGKSDARKEFPGAETSQRSGDSFAPEKRVSSRPQPGVIKNCRQCCYCGKIFPSQSQLDMHVRIHTGQKPFECEVCGKRFATKFNMQKHSWTHDKTRYDGEPQHECDICHKKFHLKLTLYTHRRDHFRNLPRASGKTPRKPRPKSEKPDQKNKATPSGPTKVKVPTANANQKLNVNSNSIDECYVETGLQKTKSDKRSLKVSKTVRKSSKKKPNSRNAASDDGETEGNEMFEDEDFHNQDDQISNEEQTRDILTKTIKVGKCVTSKKRSGSIRIPKVPKKPPNEMWGRGPRKCPHCAKEFKLPHMLKVHMRIHTGEKPYECNICHRRFADFGNKMKHVRTHGEARFEGEPKFICDICGKRYYLPGTLYHHRRRVHLGVLYPRGKSDVPTTCPICNKFIQRKSQLQQHIKRIHINEKKFNCEICSKPFNTSSEAKNHVIFHKPDKLLKALFRYKCPECPPEYIGYPSKDSVRHHYSKDHCKTSIPELFKDHWKPRVAGRWECSSCPSGNRPVYKYRTGLLRHQNKYHTNKKTPGCSVYRMTRHNMVMAGSPKKEKKAKNLDPESTSDDDLVSETESWDEAVRPTRRILRQRLPVRSHTSKYSDSECDETVQKTSKRITYNTSKSKPKNQNPRRFAKSSCQTHKLSQKLKERISELLGDKVLRIVLTRVDNDNSSHTALWKAQSQIQVGKEQLHHSSVIQRERVRIIRVCKVSNEKDMKENEEICASDENYESTTETEVKDEPESCSDENSDVD